MELAPIDQKLSETITQAGLSTEELREFMTDLADIRALPEDAPEEE